MHIVKVGGHYINLALMVDARWEPGKGRLILQFAATEPQSVGASDWASGVFSLGFTGNEAIQLLTLLDGLASTKGGDPC